MASAITRVSASFIALLLLACSAHPTDADINRSLQEQLASVHGPWMGVASPPETLTLQFSLAEESSGRVSGNGTMKESATAAAIPITVEGTFTKPNLSLSFDGMVFEGVPVTATFSGSYTTVGGISEDLVLTGAGYSRTIRVLLQEQ